MRMGRAVGKAVAERLGRSLLELGGNNAIIITANADLDIAIRGALFGAAGFCSVMEGLARSRGSRTRRRHGWGQSRGRVRMDAPRESIVGRVSGGIAPLRAPDTKTLPRLLPQGDEI